MQTTYNEVYVNILQQLFLFDYDQKKLKLVSKQE